MHSTSLQQWETVRASELDEIADAHAAVGGTKRGRRYTTQQINRAFAVLLASQFQGFCRNLFRLLLQDVFPLRTRTLETW